MEILGTGGTVGVVVGFVRGPYGLIRRLSPKEGEGRGNRKIVPDKSE